MTQWLGGNEANAPVNATITPIDLVYLLPSQITFSTPQKLEFEQVIRNHRSVISYQQKYTVELQASYDSSNLVLHFHKKILILDTDTSVFLR